MRAAAYTLLGFLSLISGPPSLAGESDAVTPAGQAHTLDPENHTGLRTLSNAIQFKFKGGPIGDNISKVISYLVGKNFISLYPTVTVATGITSVSDILYRNWGLPPDLVTKNISSTLCAWNPQNCSSNGGNGAGSWSNEEPPLDIFASATYPPVELDQEKRCSDKNLDRYVLCIPALHFKDGMSFRKVKVSGTVDSVADTIPHIVISDLQGCPNFDDKCKGDIAWANHGASIPEAVLSGAITLPVRQVTMVITRNPQVSIDEIADTLRLDASSPTKDDPTISFVVLGNGDGRAQTDVAVQEVQTQASSAVQQSSFGHLEITPNNDYYLRQMNWGDASKKISDMIQSKNLHDTIGVWDRYADLLHCDFSLSPGSARSKLLVNSNDPNGVIELFDVDRPHENYPTHFPPTFEAKIDNDATSPCPSGSDFHATQNFEPLVDHATFLAGLIAGQGNGGGTKGINPSARIWLYHVWRFNKLHPCDASGATAENCPQPDTSVMFYLKTLGVADPFIINVSYAFDRSDAQREHNLLRVVLLDNEDWPLAYSYAIVAAAGNRMVDPNQDEDDQSVCETYPACWSDSNKPGKLANNIVSVVALNEGGTDLLRCEDVSKFSSSLVELSYRKCAKPGNEHGSVSFSGENFDLAAVGTANGPFLGNAYSKLAGTSVATAYVTSLASLLEGSVEVGNGTKVQLSPWIIERMRVTADRIVDGDGKLVARFGKINFDHALSWKEDLLQVKNADSEPWLCGHIKKTSIELEYTVGDGDTKGSAWLPTVLRLTLDKNDSNLWHLIKRSKPDEPLEVVDIRNLQLKSGNAQAWLEFVKPQGASAPEKDCEVGKKFGSDVVSDYISASAPK
jgi:hypothetical protein